MLIPALCKKSELKAAYDRMRYSNEVMYYNGCIEDGMFHVAGENDDWSEGLFEYAICDEEENIIGYLSYRIDYYASGVFNFGLINFTGKPSQHITGAILHTMKYLELQNMHRIEFRCVSGNPAAKLYDRIVKRLKENLLCSVRKTVLVDTFKDRTGKYHDSYIYEITRWTTLADKTLAKERIREGTL